MGVGVRMKAVLRERKMTIKELAEKTGSPVNTLYSITKRDTENVNSEIIQRLAMALGTSTGYLSGEIEYKGSITLRHALLLEKILDCAEAESISNEDLCLQLGLPFDEWYRWLERSSFSFLDYLPEIANILDVPRKTFKKFLDGDIVVVDPEEELLTAFRQLNEHGKKIAIERLQELGKIEDYKK